MTYRSFLGGKFLPDDDTPARIRAMNQRAHWTAAEWLRQMIAALDGQPVPRTLSRSPFIPFLGTRVRQDDPMIARIRTYRQTQHVSIREMVTRGLEALVAKS